MEQDEYKEVKRYYVSGMEQDEYKEVIRYYVSGMEQDEYKEVIRYYVSLRTTVTDEMNSSTQTSQASVCLSTEHKIRRPNGNDT